MHMQFIILVRGDFERDGLTLLKLNQAGSGLELAVGDHQFKDSGRGDGCRRSLGGGRCGQGWSRGRGGRGFKKHKQTGQRRQSRQNEDPSLVFHIFNPLGEARTGPHAASVFVICAPLAMTWFEYRMIHLRSLGETSVYSFRTFVACSGAGSSMASGIRGAEGLMTQIHTASVRAGVTVSLLLILGAASPAHGDPVEAPVPRAVCGPGS